MKDCCRQSSDLELLGTYLDIMVNACRHQQYSRVELLLPGAIYDAENLDVLDSHLVSIVHDLAQYYLSKGNKLRARELFQDLIELKHKISSLNCSDDCNLEEIAMSQLSSDKGFADSLIAAGNCLIASLRKCLKGHQLQVHKA